MIKEINVLISGVGGQGNILMSELLGTAAISDGLSLRGGEVLGVAQRGGGVITMLRLGSAPQGPIIPPGRGDIMIGMELSEALRNITYMSKSSFIVVNTQKIVPITVTLGQSTYPSLEEVIKKLKENSHRVITIDAVKLGREAGSVRSANMAILGAAFGTGVLPIKVETIKKTIETRFRGGVRLFNFKAFDLGYQACQQALV